MKRTVIPLAVAFLATLILSASRTANAQYTFTTVDFPGAVSTDLGGRSHTAIVGDFDDANGTHGWLLNGAGFTQFDVPGAWFTSVTAINNHGQFGGVYREDLSHPLRRRGFIAVNGVITTIDFPGSTRTTIVHMNDHGQAVGIGRIPSEGLTQPHGFIWQGGTMTEVSFPGAFGTGLDGINEQGDLSGFTQDADGSTHAMIRYKGEFAQIEPPGAAISLAITINNKGQAAGWFDEADGTEHAFIYYRGTFTIIDPPGSIGVAAEITTISEDGVISGDYLGADGSFHGFIGVPIG